MSLRMEALILGGKERRMDDLQIIDLYWARSESAVAETSRQYGPYFRSIAYGILRSEEDSEECVNDTWLRAWDAMPPHRPASLRAFLGRITRNLSLNRLKALSAEKRGGSQVTLAVEELGESIPAPGGVERTVEDRELAELFDRFLSQLGPEARRIFVRRYWYLSPIGEIAAEYGMSESKVKMSLLRSRGKLKKLLEKEGITL